MKKLIILAIFFGLTIKCNNQKTNGDNKMEQVIEKTEIPTADQFVTSPLRSRIKLELNAPVFSVWELIGDLSRMPEYSEGLEKVETKLDSNGNCEEFTVILNLLKKVRQVFSTGRSLNGMSRLRAGLQ
jgi:hypothetical protein